MRWLEGIIDSMDMSFSKLWEIRIGKPGLLKSTGSQRVRPDFATEREVTVLKTEGLNQG